jgi:hypothetical protein
MNDCGTAKLDAGSQHPQKTVAQASIQHNSGPERTRRAADTWRPYAE